MLLSCLLIPLLSFASVLELKLGEKEREGVKLARAALWKTGDKSRELQAVGSGLRYKKVVFVKADVYVAQLFLSDPSGFERTEDGALASLRKSDAVALVMTFLRDVDAKALRNAFEEAFEKNGIAPGKEPIAGFLEAVKAGGGARDKKTIVVAGQRSGEEETVIYEDSDGKATTVNGPKGFMQAVFSLWLGKPSDSGVESLKKEILGL